MGGSKKRISLKEASRISCYHSDYLIYLIRQRQLTGQKIGRNWYTTRESLQSYLFKKNPRFLLFITPTKIKYITFFSLLILIIGAVVISNTEIGKSFSEDGVSKTLSTEPETINFVD